MASQYSLQLKAVLDTTQVKQELQKLRQMQNQILGNNRGNSVSGGTSNSSDLGNINGLNSTLGRLTNSINQLNTAINKLNVLAKTPSVQNSGVHATNAFANIAQLRGMNNISQTIRKGFESPGGLPVYRYNQRTGGWIEIQRPATTQPAPPTVATSQFTPEMKRMLGGMAFGQGLNAVSTIFGASGNTTAASVTTGFGNIGSYALMGSAAGPIGAAIGGIIGGAQTIAEAMAKSAQIIQEGAEQHKKIGQQLQVSSAGLEYDIALERKDKNYFQTRLNKEKRKAEIYASNFEEFTKNLNGESIEDYTSKTADLIQKYKVKLNEETGTVQAMFGHTPTQIRKYGTADLKKALNTIQERLFIARQLEDTIPVLQESRNKIKLYNNALNIINEPERAAEKERQEKERQEREKERIENANLNSMNAIVANEEIIEKRYKENKANIALLKDDNINVIRKSAKDYKEKSNSSYAHYQDLIQYANEATTSDAKRMYYESAMKAKNDWQFNNSQFEIFNQGLGQLLVAPLQDALSKLQAPDMTNVNSLANQGVMINRADDASREQSILDYQREQTDLQRKIKDLLEVEDYTNEAPIIQ